MLLVNLPVVLLILLVNLLIFWDWIACKLITLFVTFFHAIISPEYRFFLEVPRFEEVQDPDSSPRREEVGRRTLGAYGGFLPPFFYRARFREVRAAFSSASKTITHKPLNTLGIPESTSPRRVLHD